MPLIKSKSDKAVGKNISMEQKSGMPRKQSIAVALEIQRRAKSRKKMSDGGAVEERRASADETGDRELEMHKHPHMHASELSARDEHEVSDHDKDPMEFDMLRKDGKMMRYAKGGPIQGAREEYKPNIDTADEMEVDMLHTRLPSDEYSEEELGPRYAHGGDIVQAIRMKHKMAKGGEVDLQDSNGDEHLNLEDQLSYDAARKKTYYDISQLSDQPEDSNEKSDEIDSDSHDMVSQLRRKMRK